MGRLSIVLCTKGDNLVEITKILCVSEGDTCRGLVLAMMAKRLLVAGGCNIVVESAGTLKEAAGKPADDFAAKLLAMVGENLALQQHRGRWIGDLNDLETFDLIICFDPKQLSAIKKAGVRESAMLLLANERSGGIPDFKTIEPRERPWGISAFFQAATQIVNIFKDKGVL